MFDILVVNKNYAAEDSDSISVRIGDLVEVIDMGLSAENVTKWVLFIGDFYTPHTYIHHYLSIRTPTPHRLLPN